MVLYTHKIGQFYSSQGRQLAVSIHNYMNDGRYSTAPISVSAPTEADVLDVVHSDPLVSLTPGTSHTVFAQRIGRMIATTRRIWVYEGSKLFGGSPFNSCPDAIEALGQKRSSALCRRNIDTGKTVLGRYTLCSTPHSNGRLCVMSTMDG